MKKLGTSLMLTALLLTACGEKNAKSPEQTVDTAAAVAIEAPQEPQPAKKTVIARVFVKEGAEKNFLEAATTLLNATRNEEGNISYTLYQSTTDPKEFIFYEEYKDEAAFAAHGSSAHFAAFAESTKEMMAKDLIIEQY